MIDTQRRRQIQLLVKELSPVFKEFIRKEITKSISGVEKRLQQLEAAYSVDEEELKEVFQSAFNRADNKGMKTNGDPG